MSSWKCDRGALGDVADMAADRDIPIMQELVNEGALWGYAVAVHHWGDEWNYVTVTMAADLESGMAAISDFNSRYDERHGPDDMIDACPVHRDAIYVGSYTTRPPADPPSIEVPYVVALSYFNCPLNQINGVMEWEEEHYLPAAQASVDAGMGFWHSTLRHYWADEWTYVAIRAVDDLGSLNPFISDINQRMENRGAPQDSPLDRCPDHKDNIYLVVAETAPPSE